MGTQKQPEKIEGMKEAMNRSPETARMLAKFERQDQALRFIAEHNAGSLNLSLDRRNENNLKGPDVDRGILDEAKALERSNTIVDAHKRLLELAKNIERTHPWVR